MGRMARAGERPLSAVPRSTRWFLASTLGLQLTIHAFGASPSGGSSEIDPLPLAPSAGWLRVMALGNAGLASKLAMLWLQGYDDQPGVSVPFRRLSYDAVVSWLDVILELDPETRYPLLSAIRIYGQVNDPGRVRTMLEFVYEQFLLAPNRRWRWLAEASIVAKYRLHDSRLALRYAPALTEHATAPGVPFWARDLSVILLSDMGEYEAARGLIAALLRSGSITDPHEVEFLEKKLQEMDPTQGF